MRRAPQIIACLLLWTLGGLACDAIPITIPLDDGNKSMPETGAVADSGAARDHDEWHGDGMQSYADGVVPPWNDAGLADAVGAADAPGDGALDGAQDGWFGDGWPGDGWPGDGGDSTVGDGLFVDGGQTPIADGLLVLDAGDDGSGD